MEKMIVCIIVAVVVFFSVRRIVRLFKGKEKCCDGSCCNGCACQNCQKKNKF